MLILHCFKLYGLVVDTGIPNIFFWPTSLEKQGRTIMSRRVSWPSQGSRHQVWQRCQTSQEDGISLRRHLLLGPLNHPQLAVVLHLEARGHLTDNRWRAFSFSLLLLPASCYFQHIGELIDFKTIQNWSLIGPSYSTAEIFIECPIVYIWCALVNQCLTC